MKHFILLKKSICVIAFCLFLGGWSYIGPEQMDGHWIIDVTATTNAYSSEPLPVTVPQGIELIIDARNGFITTFSPNSSPQTLELKITDWEGTRYSTVVNGINMLFELKKDGNVLVTDNPSSIKQILIFNRKR